MAHKTTTTATQDRVTLWQRRLQAWTRSGQSQTAFCRQQHVSLAAFYYWRRRLRASTPAAEHSATFMPVQIVPHADPVGGTLAPPSPLELHLPHDRRVVLPGDFEPAVLRKLLAVLETTP